MSVYLYRLCCAAGLLHIVLLALQLGVHGIDRVFIHQLGIQRQSLHHLHIQLWQLWMLPAHIQHQRQISKILRLPAAAHGKGDVPVNVFQLLVNEGAHLIAGTWWGKNQNDDVTGAKYMNRTECQLIGGGTWLGHYHTAYRQGFLYLQAGVTQHCLTGCLWDLHSESSGAAGPFCPERFFFFFLKRMICFWKIKEGQYLINKRRFLFRLYGLHLDILAELHRLFLRLYCTFPDRAYRFKHKCEQSQLNWKQPIIPELLGQRQR